MTVHHHEMPSVDHDHDDDDPDHVHHIKDRYSWVMDGPNTAEREMMWCEMIRAGYDPLTFAEYRGRMADPAEREHHIDVWTNDNHHETCQRCQDELEAEIAG